MTDGPTYERQVKAMEQLRVSPLRANDGQGLLVDASALVTREKDIERWVLLDQIDGLWVHPESGERGPLSEILRAIACCYLAIPDPAEVIG